MSDQKFCVNCKHFRPDYVWWLLFIPVIGWVVFAIFFLTKSHIEFGKCSAAPKRYSGKAYLSDSMVNGFYYASVERMGISENDCGPTGNKYEEKK